MREEAAQGRGARMVKWRCEKRELGLIAGMGISVALCAGAGLHWGLIGVDAEADGGKLLVGGALDHDGVGLDDEYSDAPLKKRASMGGAL